MRLSPWQHTLFLDTDTYVTTDLGHLFEMLEDGFDLLAHQLFEGHNYGLEGVPDAFPEFNTGVIGFRNTPDVQRFFEDWNTWYGRYVPSITCDQRSFRKAVYLSGLRHSVLTPEYNFRPLSTNFAIHRSAHYPWPAAQRDAGRSKNSSTLNWCTALMYRA